MSTKFGLRPLVLAAGVAVGSLMAASSAQAVAISFTKITNNGNTDVSSQLAADVTDAGGGQVAFKFTNAVGVASSITDIYFDDNSTAVLLSLVGIANSAGVSFSAGASPPNLPGGAPFSFDADFASDSDSPTTSNGVNAAGEFVTLTFNLVGGKTFADVLAELGSGELELGLHVQAIAPQGGSDSYISTGTPPTNVPEPATLGLFGAGLLGLGLLRQRRKS